LALRTPPDPSACPLDTSGSYCDLPPGLSQHFEKWHISGHVGAEDSVSGGKKHGQ